MCVDGQYLFSCVCVCLCVCVCTCVLTESTSDMVNSYLCMCVWVDRSHSTQPDIRHGQQLFMYVCVCVDRSQWDEESTAVNLTPEMVNAQFSLVDASLPAEDSKPARLVSLCSASSGCSPLRQHFQLSKQKTKTEDTHTHKNNNR